MKPTRSIPGAAWLFGGYFCWALLSSSTLSAQVKLEEKIFTIPSYEQKAPNPMPRFYEGKSHQGVQRRIYPYPFDDGLTPNKRDQEYPMIHLENEYIDLAVSPQLGGRIYYADDKTNQYNYLYHNHVVKPSLIGMIGNWISGSLAWGYPHHHGPNTVESLGYKVEEKADGSKTVWVRSWDRRHRMEVEVGYSVYPHSSIIEMTIHPRNRTALSNSFLFWANPAVHCDSAYQVIFPPSVKYVTFHGKNQMTAWPIADSRFNGYDFTGMDISWWKNTRVPSSFFSWDPREDYFAGYDHAKEAGTAWVGNHYVCPGMKYWADGNNPNGAKTNEGLTDADGRYIELMAGFYTDNQPDYSWLQPYETKIGTMIWFPIRELGGLKYANREGALNYTLEGTSLEVRLNATSPHSGARLVIRATGRTVTDQTLSISPAEPRRIVCDLPAGTAETDLDLFLYDENGQVLLAYRPADHPAPDYAKPEPLKPFPKPGEMQSVEELYLAGLRLDQFYNASADPMPYYLEALKRDPKNYDVNLQLGLRAVKAYDWIAAEQYFRTAVERITSHYTRPKDGEGLYYLGIALRALGKEAEAYDYLYRASWSAAWHTAAYFQLAEMDCMRKDYPTALEHLNLSIATQTDNMRAQNLKAYVLRKLGQNQAAADLLQTVLDTSKINHMALNESYGLGQRPDDLSELGRLMRDDPQDYLELAWEYAEAGAYPEAADVLGRLERKECRFPLVYYTLGYYAAQQGQSDDAVRYFRKAAALSTDYCYPFRHEEVYVLKEAMRQCPEDARAPYYLGNLLYEHQPEEAIAYWEKSLALDPSFYITRRNLGLAYKEIRKDYRQALTYTQQAFAACPTDARLLFELDELNDLNKVAPQEKYAFLKKHRKVAESRSETTLRLATRAVEAGQYAEAVRWMDTHFIIESEGAREKQDNYLNSYMLLALECARKKQYDAAIGWIDKALAYPIGLYGRSCYAQLYYTAGSLYRQKGDTQRANDSFRQAAAVVADRPGDGEYTYYKAMALIALGQQAEGQQLLQTILDQLQTGSETFFTQFEGGRQNQDKRLASQHYQAGLAYEGLGNREKAREEYQKALTYHPAHVWCQAHLRMLNF